MFSLTSYNSFNALTLLQACLAYNNVSVAAPLQGPQLPGMKFRHTVVVVVVHTLLALNEEHGAIFSNSKSMWLFVACHRTFLWPNRQAYTPSAKIQGASGFMGFTLFVEISLLFTAALARSYSISTHLTKINVHAYWQISPSLWLQATLQWTFKIHPWPSDAVWFVNHMWLAE